VKASSCILPALALLFVVSVPAHADDSVASRIKNLEETVQALELRVASLEAQLHNQPATARVAPDKVVWRKLRQGMAQADVEALLGSPAKVDNFGHFVVWHYGNRTGGEVTFDTNSGKVTGWHEPD